MSVLNSRLARTFYIVAPLRMVLAIILALAFALSACSPDGASPSPAFDGRAGAPGNPGSPQAQRHSLGIKGYNYTNTAIEAFKVAYRGGDMLSVSSPGGGGGGLVCCASVSTPLNYAPTMNVQWWRNHKTCELNVPLTLPVPPEPKTLAVHFYEDGHVEVEASDDVAPPPRLKLERFSEVRRHKDDAVNIVNDEKFARCSDGYAWK